MTYTSLSSFSWHYFHVRKRTPFYVWLWVQGVLYPTKEVLPYKLSIKGPIGHVNHAVIVELNDWNSSLKQSIAWYHKNPRYLFIISDAAYKDIKNHLSLWKKIGKVKNWSKKSNAQLLKVFISYVDSIMNWDYFIFPHLWLEPYLEQELAKYLSKEEYNIAVDPIKKGIVALEREHLLKMVLIYQRGKNIEKDLQKHAENFGWLINNKYDLSFTSKEDYFKKILSIPSPQQEFMKEKRSYQEKVMKYRDLLKKQSHKKEIIDLIESAQEAVFFRSFRTEKLFQSGIYLQKLLLEIALRIGVGFKEIVYLTPPEIISCLENNNNYDRTLIFERMKGFALLPPSVPMVVAGKELEQLNDHIHLFNIQGTKLQGHPAYLGKVRGQAYVVQDLKELTKVQEGGILVCNSTTPDFVPFLHKVTAIITDEGGICCHAAVISRELKIPCIIGTKFATKVLKDGDLVEVDANKGIVRKLR